MGNTINKLTRGNLNRLVNELYRTLNLSSMRLEGDKFILTILEDGSLQIQFKNDVFEDMGDNMVCVFDSSNIPIWCAWFVDRMIVGNIATAVVSVVSGEGKDETGNLISVSNDRKGTPYVDVRVYPTSKENDAFQYIALAHTKILKPLEIFLQGRLDIYSDFYNFVLPGRSSVSLWSFLGTTGEEYMLRISLGGAKDFIKVNYDAFFKVKGIRAIGSFECLKEYSDVETKDLLEGIFMEVVKIFDEESPKVSSFSYSASSSVGYDSVRASIRNIKCVVRPSKEQSGSVELDVVKSNQTI